MPTTDRKPNPPENNDKPRIDDFAALSLGAAVTTCCGAYATFHDGALCCKACWREVG